jgi:hypothetical protein
MAAELDQCSSGEPGLFNELEHDNGSRLPPARDFPGLYRSRFAIDRTTASTWAFHTEENRTA